VQEVVLTIPRALIAETVNLIVFLERVPGGRRVTDLAAVTGLVQGEYVLRKVDSQQRKGQAWTSDLSVVS
jgi:type IV secretion system protein VirB11